MSSLLEHRSAPAPAPAEDELERLWAESPAAPLEEPLPAELPDAVRVLRQVVGWGWPAFILLAALVAPSGAEDMPRAAWVDPTSWAMLGLLALGYLALAAPRIGFSLFAGAGALGVALGIDCRVSAHHLGAWWMVETTIVAGLAAASIAGVVLLSRR